MAEVELEVISNPMHITNSSYRFQEKGIGKENLPPRVHPH